MRKTRERPLPRKRGSAMPGSRADVVMPLSCVYVRVLESEETSRYNRRINGVGGIGGVGLSSLHRKLWYRRPCR